MADPPLPEHFLTGAWISFRPESGWARPIADGHQFLVGDADVTRLVSSPSAAVDATLPWAVSRDRLLDVSHTEVLLYEPQGAGGRLLVRAIESGEERWSHDVDEAPDVGAFVRSNSHVAVAVGRRLLLLENKVGRLRAEHALDEPARDILGRAYRTLFLVRGATTLRVHRDVEDATPWSLPADQGRPLAAVLAGEETSVWVALAGDSPRLARYDVDGSGAGPGLEVPLDHPATQLEVTSAGGAVYALLRVEGGPDEVVSLDPKDGRVRYGPFPLRPPDQEGRLEVEAIRHGPGETWLFAQHPDGMSRWEHASGRLLQGGGPLGTADEAARLEALGLGWVAPSAADAASQGDRFLFEVARDDLYRLTVTSRTTGQVLLAQRYPPTNRDAWRTTPVAVAPSGEMVAFLRSHPETTLVKKGLVDLCLLSLELRAPRTLEEHLHVHEYREVTGPWPPLESLAFSDDGSRIALRAQETPEVFVHRVRDLWEQGRPDDPPILVHGEPPPPEEKPAERIAADPQLRRYDDRIEALEDQGMTGVDAVERSYDGVEGGYSDTRDDAVGAAWGLLQDELRPLRQLLDEAAIARIRGDEDAARRALARLEEALRKA